MFWELDDKNAAILFYVCRDLKESKQQSKQYNNQKQKGSQ